MAPVSELVGGMSRLNLKSQRREESDTTKAERAIVANAIFVEHLGETGSRLAGWQNLCYIVNEEPGKSIKQCKKILRGVNVCIYDLVEALQDDSVVPMNRLFDSPKSLRQYLRRHRDMIFPKDEAKENVFLKVMLRGIL